MWRIYYYPVTGKIKYQINVEAASQLEPMPFVDYSAKQNIDGKKIDLASKTLVDDDPIPVLAPSFSRPEKITIRDFKNSK